MQLKNQLATKSSGRSLSNCASNIERVRANSFFSNPPEIFTKHGFLVISKEIEVINLVVKFGGDPH